MVIPPNNHQRVVHMRILNWFFAESTDSQTPFCPLPLEKLDHSQALLQYLSDRKLLENGEYVAINPYHFTVNDVRFLLINRIDLTTLNYFVHDVSPEHYEKLYNIAYVNRLPLTGLHGIQVIFSQKELSDHMVDLLLNCTPSFQNAIIGLPELNKMATDPKYYDYFSKDDLQFTVSYCVENTNTQQTINIDAQKLHAAITSFSATSLPSSFFFKEKTKVIQFIQRLSASILNTEKTPAADISKGELLLSALVCAFFSQHNPIGKLFWETQGITPRLQ